MYQLINKSVIYFDTKHGNQCIHDGFIFLSDTKPQCKNYNYKLIQEIKKQFLGKNAFFNNILISFRGDLQERLTLKLSVKRSNRLKKRMHVIMIFVMLVVIIYEVLIDERFAFSFYTNYQKTKLRSCKSL